MRRLLALMAVGLALTPHLGLACRYNVRDVGFVDLDPEPYRLCAFVRGPVPPGTEETVRQAAAAALWDSNVVFEWVDAARSTDHPALRAQLGAAEGLQAVLLSPEGRALGIPVPGAGVPDRPRLESALRRAASSPKRGALVRAVSESFGVVLLIEGPNDGENQRARRAVAGAIDRIRAQMKALPKAVAHPPAQVTIEAAAAASEEVLLWSLGLGPGMVESARVAVVYGRARWMGPLMKGEEITESNLSGILGIVGADCECGLDLAWTQGTRLPVKWLADPGPLARSLGFDPESPPVKLEVSRILGRRGTAPSPAQGYQEIALDSPPSASASVTVTQAVGERPPSATRRAAVREPDEPANPWPGRLLWLGGTMAVSILAVGAGIAWRAASTR